MKSELLNPPRVERSSDRRQHAEIAPSANCGGVGASDHFVQFYEEDRFLVGAVSEFIGAGLGSGEGAVVIATAEHREAIARQLEEQGLVLESLSHRGQLALLDAAETLERFMREGMPDEDLFTRTMTPILVQAGNNRRGLRAFGEMVAVLCAEGKQAAAIRLEELWNKLGKQQRFSLFCAYPMKQFHGTENSQPFAHVCSAHSRVLPSESYASLPRSAEERLRSVAELQQKAGSLEAEIVERKRVERELLRAQQELETKIEDLRLLHEVTSRLGTMTELKTMLEEVLRGALAVHKTDKGLFSLADEQGQLKVAVSSGFDGSFLKLIENVPAGAGACAKCSAEHRRVMVEDTEKDPIFEAYREAARAGGFRAVHCTPIITDSNKLIGVLSVHFAEPRHPSQREIQLMDLYAQQAAGLIEKTRMQQELRRRTDELSNFVETASVGLHWVGPDGMIMWANPADYEPLGYSHDEYVGHNIAEFHADRQVIEEILARLTRGERLRDYRARLKCKDGSIRRVLIDSSVLWEDGKFIHTQCFTRDVTDRESAEEALQESQARFQAILDNSATVIFAKDLQGRYILVNSWFEKIFQRPRCEIIGKTDFELFPERTARKFQQNDLVVLSSGAPLRIEETVPHEDGLHDYLSIKFPLRKADGTIYAVTGIATDITDRKKDEAAARRLAAIVASSDDAIIGKDLEGTITDWNAGAERLYGYTADEVIGKPVTVLIPEDHHNEEPQILDRVRRGERIEHYETVRRCKDGTRIDVSLTVSPIKDRDGKIIGASKIARDIRDRKRATERLEQAVAERTSSLRQAVEQMEEFSYTVSHDLRAPLRAMRTYSEVLLEEFAKTLPSEAQHYMQRIAANASRLDAMVSDVLTFSRIARAELRLEKVSADQLVRQMVEQYPGLQPPHAKIVVEPLMDVRGHMPSLTQALSNLLNNAVKFVAPGIMPEVRVWTERTGDQVRLWVQDNGIGVEPRCQHRLFNMFERVHPNLKYDGTGVGLAIVRKATERMGGTVGMESDGKNGSKFWIELKAAD